MDLSTYLKTYYKFSNLGYDDRAYNVYNFIKDRFKLYEKKDNIYYLNIDIAEYSQDIRDVENILRSIINDIIPVSNLLQTIVTELNNHESEVQIQFRSMNGGITNLWLSLLNNYIKNYIRYLKKDKTLTVWRGTADEFKLLEEYHNDTLYLFKRYEI